MTTYILKITGTFRSLEEIEDFCSNYLVTNKHLKIFRYVIQNTNNLIVSFQSNENPDMISVDIGETLVFDNRVLFYFLIKKDNILGFYMPNGVAETLFFNESIYDSDEMDEFLNDDNLTKVEVKDKEKILNVLLDKIEAFGISSLTEKEKNFLDEFYL